MKSISTQKAHKTSYKQGSILHYLGTNHKAALLDKAHREASKAVSSIERLTDECHGLRGDLQIQETLVVQRDGAIASLRDEACTQWAFG